MTVGEMIGLPVVIEKELITEHQYLSKWDGNWHKCSEWEIPLYQKYLYEVRIITKEKETRRVKSFYELALGI